MLRRLRMQGLLSFADVTLELNHLNVLIGPNGSGKSNLVDVVGLLGSLPKNVLNYLAGSGGADAWLRAAAAAPAEPSMIVDADFEFSSIVRKSSPHYHVEIFDSPLDTYVYKEELTVGLGDGSVQVVAEQTAGTGRLLNSSSDSPTYEELDLDVANSSLLELHVNPNYANDLNYVRNLLSALRIYRGWETGVGASLREPVRVDVPKLFLEPDGSNLALVLNSLDRLGKLDQIETEMRHFYEPFQRFKFFIEAQRVQLYVQESSGTLIPASRLSDGTLRYLCLLAVLLHPSPPPLICLEEPETGLHPDILYHVARLLEDASARTQLIVTTHSEILLNYLRPEDVVVCERDEQDQTAFRRLSADDLRIWLEKYTLGELWRSGEIGGKRW
jgi:predicted ATPase